MKRPPVVNAKQGDDEMIFENIKTNLTCFLFGLDTRVEHLFQEFLRLPLLLTALGLQLT